MSAPLPGSSPSSGGFWVRETDVTGIGGQRKRRGRRGVRVAISDVDPVGRVAAPPLPSVNFVDVKPRAWPPDPLDASRGSSLTRAASGPAGLLLALGGEARSGLSAAFLAPSQPSLSCGWASDGEAGPGSAARARAGSPGAGERSDGDGGFPHACRERCCHIGPGSDVSAEGSDPDDDVSDGLLYPATAAAGGSGGGHAAAPAPPLCAGVVLLEDYISSWGADARASTRRPPP